MKTMKGNKGFTLLEILAALAVLAVGLVSVLSLFPMGFQSTKRAAETSVASLYGQKQLETILTRGYDYVIANESASGTFDEDPYYQWEYNTLPTGPTTADPLLFVVLGVYWPTQAYDAGGANPRRFQQNMKFTTYVTDYSAPDTKNY